MKQVIVHIFYLEGREILKMKPSHDCLLYMGCQLIILEVFDRPEAKVHAIEDEKLKQGSLGVFLCLVEGVFIERDETEPFCKYFEFLLVDRYMFGPRGDVAASGTDKSTLVGHKRNVNYIPKQQENNRYTNTKTNRKIYFHFFISGKGHYFL